MSKPTTQLDTPSHTRPIVSIFLTLAGVAGGFYLLLTSALPVSPPAGVDWLVIALTTIAILWAQNVSRIGAGTILSGFFLGLLGVSLFAKNTDTPYAITTWCYGAELGVLGALLATAFPARIRFWLLKKPVLRLGFLLLITLGLNLFFGYRQLSMTPFAFLIFSLTPAVAGFFVAGLLLILRRASSKKKETPSNPKKQQKNPPSDPQPVEKPKPATAKKHTQNQKKTQPPPRSKNRKKKKNKSTAIHSSEKTTTTPQEKPATPPRAPSKPKPVSPPKPQPTPPAPTPEPKPTPAVAPMPAPESPPEPKPTVAPVPAPVPVAPLPFEPAPEPITPVPVPAEPAPEPIAPVPTPTTPEFPSKQDDLSSAFDLLDRIKKQQ